MITRDLRTMGRGDVYRVLSSLVVPRPIAWITTLGEGGRVNLAPFSSFMGIFGPPVVAVNFGRRSSGALKDTHANLRERREAVVHIADTALLPELHASGSDAPPEASEIEILGLGTMPSRLVSPPRLALAPVALECVLRQEVPLGAGSTLVLLDVLMAHVQERIWDERLDCARADRWKPLARLVGGGVDAPNYAALGELFSLGKPKLP